MSDLERIANTIRTARKEAALTQAELADLAEISERTVRAIETASGNPSSSAFASVANVLGFRIEMTR